MRADLRARAVGISVELSGSEDEGEEEPMSEGEGFFGHAALATFPRAAAEAAPGGALDPTAVPESNAGLNAALGWLGGVLLAALTTNARRRTRMAAGVLSCALHPCLFDPRQQGIPEEEGLALHRPGGAVRGMVEGLKAAGGRHSRLLVLFSTQLAALLAAFPALGPCYTDFLVDWILTGFEEDTAVASLGDVALDEPTVAELHRGNLRAITCNPCY